MINVDSYVKQEKGFMVWLRSQMILLLLGRKMTLNSLIEGSILKMA